MLFDNKEEFLQKIPQSSRLLGLDVGSKTIGLAISDYTQMLASPLKTINRKKFSIDIIVLDETINADSISGLVVGLPLNMDSNDNKSSQSIRQFVRNLLKEFDIPIFFWDERFSTIAVERALLDADMSRQKRAKVIDKMAASYILQGFLDSLDKNR